MKDFLDTISARKSIRSFAATPVPREVVENILKVAVQAPTNCNQQLWNFIVIDDSSLKERLIHEAAGNTMFRRAPVLIVVTYDNWNYKEAIQGASLAVGHIILAAAYFGLGGSPLNSFGAESKVKRILGIPDSETICCFVTLGYPDERAQKAPPVPRKDAQSVTHWNGFEKRVTPSFSYNPEKWTSETLSEHQRHYCRKTFLGKEMDLAGYWERALVEHTLAPRTPPFLNIFSYDGSYSSHFPEGELHTLDLTEETAAYSKAAAVLKERTVVTHVYTEAHDVLPGAPHTITLLYKRERIPRALFQRVCAQAYRTLPMGGTFVIVARKRFSLLSPFFALLALAFGTDVRKTGIYAFWGPYRPIVLQQTIRDLKTVGFQTSWSGYFAFPAFFEQVYQMAVQYIRSEGSSYLHRERRDDLVSRSIAGILKAQGFLRCGWLGSVVVIVCKK